MIYSARQRGGDHAHGPGGTLLTEDSDAKRRKAFDAFDWCVRVYAPRFLRMAQLEEHAQRLAGLRKIVSLDQIDSQVYSPLKRISEDMKKRRKRLLIAAPPIFMLQDRIWDLLTSCFGAAGLPGYMHSDASEVSDIADRAAKIAVASGAATAEEVREKERALEQQLTAVLNSAG
jgi:hypothetical protein